MPRRLRLDSAGILELLKSELVQEAVYEKAEEIAEGTAAFARNNDEIPVLIGEYRTDRAVAAVTLAHPAGLGVEAKYGYLRHGAAAAGLDFRDRSDFDELGGPPNELVDYTTQAGVRRKATRAQVANWTRGSSR